MPSSARLRLALSNITVSDRTLGAQPHLKKHRKQLDGSKFNSDISLVPPANLQKKALSINLNFSIITNRLPSQMQEAGGAREKAGGNKLL